MKNKTEELRFIKQRKSGEVEAVHVWATGYQYLVFSSRERFDRAVEAMNKQDEPLKIV